MTEKKKKNYEFQNEEYRDFRFIEFGAKNSVVGDILYERGIHKYLGLVYEIKYWGNIKKTAKTKDKYYLFKKPKKFNCFNADVVILSTLTPKWLWKSIHTKNVKFIYFKFNYSFPTLFYLMFLSIEYMWKSLSSFKIVKFKDGLFFFKLERKQRKKFYTPPRYISPLLGITNFLKKFDELGIKYVVLRWFENLQELKEVDLLVSDEDIKKVDEIFNSYPGIIPCDVYTVSGHFGCNYQSFPYYSPKLAKRILENRKKWKGMFWVPSTEDYFWSLLYHVVYHKGITSGFPIEKVDESLNFEDNKYYKVLRKLSEKLNIPFEPNLIYLHKLLQNAGWTPGIELLKKLATFNKWLELILPPVEKSKYSLDGELITYIIRDCAVKRNLTDYIINLIDGWGIDIIYVKTLNEKECEVAVEKLRGGNWLEDPVSGLPNIMVIAYDFYPVPLSKRLRKKYPYIVNEHFFLKNKIRKKINRTLPKEERINPVHSTDNEEEAWKYINTISPELSHKVEEEIEKRRKIYFSHEIVETWKKFGHRTKIELIRYNGHLAVKKTFKLNKGRFFEREKFVYGELSKICPFIPPLLNYGPSYVIIPYYENLLNRSSRKKLLKKFGKEIIEIMKFFYDKGYAIIDFHPQNIIITPDYKLKTVDFEYLYKYEKKPENFLESYDIVGVPPDFKGDLPGDNAATYRRCWEPILGKIEDWL